MSNAIWQLEADSAMLTMASLAATVDLPRPTMGLHNIAVSGRRIESAKIFQLSPPPLSLSRADAWQLEDCYCRGRDLIVTFAPSKEYPLRTQLIWRAHNTDDPSVSLGGIELIVSVQTDTVGTDPQVCAESTITSRGTLRYVESAGPTFVLLGADTDVSNHAASHDTASNGYLIRLPNSPDRVAHFVHPDDYCGARLSSRQTPQGMNLRIAHPLFSGELEKGVILRVRMAVFFFTGNDDAMKDDAMKNDEVENAIRAYHQFIAQPLPLAT